MSLDSIVSVDISISSASISKPGFGTTLILASCPTAVDTAWGIERVRTYSSAAAMLAAGDGFTVNDQAYKIAVGIFSQNPKPQRIKVGRRTRKQTQTLKLTPTTTAVGHVYGSTVNGTTWTYTVLVADTTVAAVCAKLVTAITAAAPVDVTAADHTSYITLTSGTAGKVHEHKNFSSGLTVEDTTVDPGIATDFAEVAAVDKDFYTVKADTFGAAEIGALATAIEATQYKYNAQTADSAAHEAGSADIGGVLHAASTFRTAIDWSPDYTWAFSAGKTGVESVSAPGTYTLFGKTVSGALPADSLTETQTGNLDRKHYNYYQSIGGVGRVIGGRVIGNEYEDNVRGLDWLRATMQVNIANAMFAASKIPNTAAGREVIKGQIAVSLEQAISKPAKPGLLAPDPAPVITMPPVSDASSFDSTTRTLSGVSWTAALANAIHAVQVTGTVTE